MFPPGKTIVKKKEKVNKPDLTIGIGYATILPVDTKEDPDHYRENGFEEGAIFRMRFDERSLPPRFALGAS
jgi:hypothetical protein